MERKSWTIDIGGTTHAVVLSWTYWGGGRQVSLDGTVVDDNTLPMRWKSQQRFEIAGHPALVETKPVKRLSPYFAVSLHVDGEEVTPDPGERSAWER